MLFQGKGCIFILGVNNDKNINAIYRELSPLSKLVIATQSQNPRSMDARAVAEAVSFQSSSEKLSTRITRSVAEAIEEALAVADADDVICIVGSLYVVAEAREVLLKNTAKDLVALRQQDAQW